MIYQIFTKIKILVNIIICSVIPSVLKHHSTIQSLIKYNHLFRDLYSFYCLWKHLRNDPWLYKHSTIIFQLSNIDRHIFICQNFKWEWCYCYKSLCWFRCTLQFLCGWRFRWLFQWFYPLLLYFYLLFYCYFCTKYKHINPWLLL